MRFAYFKTESRSDQIAKLKSKCSAIAIILTTFLLPKPKADNFDDPGENADADAKMVPREETRCGENF